MKVQRIDTAEDRTIKLTNLNVYDGGRFMESISSYLLTQKPDILTLQEVYSCDNTAAPMRFNTISALPSHFSNYYTFYSPEFKTQTEFGDVVIGNAILSRYPIIQKKTLFLSGEYATHPQGDVDPANYPKNMQICRLDIPGLPLNLCNLHGIWDRTTKDTEDRFHMVQVILSTLARYDRIVIAGDFNVSIETKTMSLMRKKYTQVFDHLSSTLNFNIKDRAKYAPEDNTAVDMIYTSSNIHIIDKKMPHVDLSDHYPLEIVISP